MEIEVSPGLCTRWLVADSPRNFWSRIRTLLPTAIRIVWGPLAVVAVNACLTIPMAIVGWRDDAMWYMRLGLSGPLWGHIFGHPVDAYDVAVLAGAVALCEAYATRPTSAFAVALLVFALFWNLFGWAV